MSKPDDIADKLVAEREAALYDPDSRFRDHAAELAASRAAVDEKVTLGDLNVAPAPLYARRERRRMGTPLTPEMIKRMADRAEEATKRK